MGVLITSSYAVGLGKPRARQLSMPQGCPWPMTIWGLVVVPWLNMISWNHVFTKPRALADDMAVTTEEPIEGALE